MAKHDFVVKPKRESGSGAAGAAWGLPIAVSQVAASSLQFIG
jgi:hypothetical protein